MAKKQFFITISMNKPEFLKRVSYIPEYKKDFVPMPVTAPGLTMIEMNLEPDDDCEIITIMTDDVNGRTVINYETFKNELSELSKKLGRELSITKEIHIPHEESKEKHIEFFRNVCDAFEPFSEVYMDVTFGTKISSISEFASLVYAEKTTRCKIRDVIYGQYNHNDGEEGYLFSVRCVYELKELIQSASVLGNVDIDKMLDNFGGANDEL